MLTIQSRTNLSNYIVVVNGNKKGGEIRNGVIWNIRKSYYEACPLNNQQNRKFVLEGGPKFEKLAEKYNVKVLAQYHSGLEHTFLWVVDAKDALVVEELMIEAGVSRFNALKVVPLVNFAGVIERCRKIESS